MSLTSVIKELSYHMMESISKLSEKTPQETMIFVAESALFGLPEPIFSPRCCPKPGQAYLKLPERIRDILKNLKSDDISKIRPDLIYFDCIP